VSELLLLKDLYLHHRGLTSELSGALCQAASVCLARHHRPPTDFTVRVDAAEAKQSVQWEMPSPAARHSNANASDAIRDGAYAISLLFVEHCLHLVAIGRAEEATGADWYIAPFGEGFDANGEPNIDAPGVFRLEVSGQELGRIGARLTQKPEQLRKGKSSLPGIAAVVGFERTLVEIAHGE
jgi:hypothetical protein